MWAKDDFDIGDQTCGLDKGTLPLGIGGGSIKPEGIHSCLHVSQCSNTLGKISTVEGKQMV